MKKTFQRLASFSILLCSHLALAQDTAFDPNKIDAKYYQDASIKHKVEFDDKKGNSYKIQKSKYSRGLYIKHDKKWLKHGIWYSLRSSDGTVSSQTTYYYGKKHGEHQSFHSNGKIQFRYSYEENLKQGTWSQYNDKGSMVEEKQYKDNLKEGVCISYHIGKNGTTGLKQFEKIYIQDKRHGETRQYNEKGKLLSTSQYNMGVKVGKTQWVK